MLILEAMNNSDISRNSTRSRLPSFKLPWDIVSCILIGILFYQDMLFDDQVIVFRDTATILYPTEVIAHHLLQTSWLPLWNPFFVFGKPFLAEPLSGALYPPQWLFRQFTLPFAISLNILFHHLLAAFGVIWCGRILGASISVRLVCAVLFSFGGIFVALDNMTNALQSAAWMPFSAGLSFLIMRNPRALSIIALHGVVLSLSFLGGMPEVVFLEILFLIFCWLAERGSFKNLAQLAALVTVSLFICIALSAVQLLPLVEYIQSSQRSYGLNPATIFRFSAHPSDILALLSLPRPFAEFLFSTSTPAPTISSDHWAISLYLGPSLIFLVVLFRSPRTSPVITWSFATALVFALSLGKNMPGLPTVISYIPVQVMRYPDKMLLLMHLILIAGVAVGLSSSIKQPRYLRSVGLTLVVGAFGHVLAWLLLSSFGHNQTILTAILSSGLFWLLIGALAFIASRSPSVIPVLLVILASDVVFANYRLHPQMSWNEVITPTPSTPGSPSDTAPTQIYSALRPVRSSHESHHDLFRRAKAMLQDGIGSFYGLRNVSTPSSINLASHTSFIFLLRSLPIERQLELLSAFGTKFIVSDQLISSASARLFSTNTEVSVYELISALPLVYIPSQVIQIGNTQSWSDIIRDKFAAGMAVVEAPSSDLEGLATMSDDRSIELSEVFYRPGSIEFTITATTPTFAVINESFYPGWRAEVNDETLPLYRTNGVVMGLRIPEGKNAVRIFFQSTSLIQGAWVSGIALTVLTLFLTLSLKGDRGRRNYLGKLSDTDGFSSITPSAN